MKKIFLDSDVILDVLLKRPEFYIPASNIFILINQPNFKIVTSTVAFVNVHYFLNKFDRVNKFSLLKRLRSAISVLHVTETHIDQALKSGLNDFEDAVQYYASISAGVDVIVTRNIKDYQHSAIPVLTPEQFLKTL